MVSTPMLLACMLTGSAFAANTSGACEKKGGSTNCNKQHLSHLNSHGIVSLSHTRIEKKCSVQGILKADQSTFGELHMVGKAVLSNSAVLNKSSVFGSLDAQKTRFHGPLHMHAQALSARESAFARIDVYPDTNAPSVTLQKQSEVQGDIVFHNHPGLVYVDSSSRVHGNIINGKKTQAMEVK